VKTNTHFNHISLTVSYNEIFFQKKCIGYHITHFMFNIFFFEKLALCGMWKKYYAVKQETDDNVAQARCMLDN